MAELDPVRASLDFSRLAEELIGLFSASPGTQVTIKVDIEAKSTEGFGESVVRAAKENGKVLGVRSVDFE